MIFHDPESTSFFSLSFFQSSFITFRASSSSVPIVIFFIIHWIFIPEYLNHNREPGKEDFDSLSLPSPIFSSLFPASHPNQKKEKRKNKKREEAEEKKVYL